MTQSLLQGKRKRDDMEQEEQEESKEVIHERIERSQVTRSIEQPEQEHPLMLVKKNISPTDGETFL